MPNRRSTAPANLRNGLTWRSGRPRWEPSPANRKAGLKGRDLKREDGTWMDRGEAIGVADVRARWADAIRTAKAGGADGAKAVQALSGAIDRLPPPADELARWRRVLVQDLIDAGRVLLGELPAGYVAAVAPGERTVARLVAAYFDPNTGARFHSPSTRSAYATQAKKIVAGLGHLRAAEVTHRKITDWYRKMVETDLLSLATANQAAATLGSIYSWAVTQDPPWVVVSPVAKLKMETPAGRLVFWTMEEERTFTAWADANGYADLADGIVAGLWTGARIGDICAASLADLAGEVWLFTPHKTRRKKQQAMPAIMPALRARVERRRAQAVTGIAQPFLFDPRKGRPHDTDSFGDLFRKARAEFVASGAAPDGFAGKHVADTRDTCITRLWEADVAPARMWAWTGHSQKSIETILRDHYLVLRAKGSLAMAEKLTAWAVKEGLALQS